MAAIQFYTNPMSRGQIVRWALHEVGADYEQRLLGYGAEMKSAAFRAINPMGKVPAIELDGIVVTETAAICAWLAEQYPAAALTPASPTERAAYYRWMFFAAGPVEAAVTARSMQWEITEEQEKSAGFGNYDTVIGALDSHFERNDFVCGDRFTMADVYVGSQVMFGLMFGTFPKTEPFNSYAARLGARTAYQAANAIDGELIAQAQAQAQTPVRQA